MGKWRNEASGQKLHNYGLNQHLYWESSRFRLGHGFKFSNCYSLTEGIRTSPPVEKYSMIYPAAAAAIGGPSMVPNLIDMLTHTKRGKYFKCI